MGNQTYHIEGQHMTGKGETGLYLGTGTLLEKMNRLDEIIAGELLTAEELRREWITTSPHLLHARASQLFGQHQSSHNIAARRSAPQSLQPKRMRAGFANIDVLSEFPRSKLQCDMDGPSESDLRVQHVFQRMGSHKREPLSEINRLDDKREALGNINRLD